MKRNFIVGFLFTTTFCVAAFFNCSATTDHRIPPNENVGGLYNSSSLSGYGGKNQGGEYQGGQAGNYFDAGISDVTIDVQEDGSPCLVKEICGNGIDDNCNYQIDDWCPCIDNGVEVCDGKDNDCDGKFDEDLFFDEQNFFCGRENGPWNAENGTCYYGLTSCTNGKLSCSWYFPSSEDYCENYFDDDCDGLVNENCPCLPGTKSECYSFNPTYDINNNWKITKCGKPFYMFCNDSGFFDGICPADIFPSTEICGNGQDEDCDGWQDDICP